MRRFLVGNMAGKSLSDYRRALLVAYVIMVALATCIYYIVINLRGNYNPSVYFYYIFIVALLLCFWLNRSGRHYLAKTIILAFVNLIVFAFSSREPPVPAAFVFYIVASLVPLAVYDMKERRTAIFFMAL